MKKKLFSILLSFSIVLTLMLAMSMTAMAATDKEEGIKTEQTVDTSGGNVKVTLKVTAEDGYSLEGITLKNQKPDGYKLLSGETELSEEVIQSGKSKSLTTVFTKDTGSIKTGDSNSHNIFIYGGIAIICAALVIFSLTRIKKGNNNIFKIFLCCIVITAGVAAFAGKGFASEGNQINLSKDVTIGSETVTVKSVVSYDRVVANKYNVTAQVQGDHGTATVKVGDGEPTSETTQASKGTNLVFTATPNDGYEFDYWEVVSGGIDSESVKNNAVITVTMPATALTLKAHFKVIIPSEYGIIVEDDGHGTASANPTSSAPGTSVTLSATPNDGFAFKEWVDVRDNAPDFDKTTATTTLTMPASEIKVKATFERVYNINLQTNEHGTVTASVDGETVTTAAANAEVTLTATPAEGYQFKEWSVVSGDVTVNDNQFTMPEGNVTIMVVFEEIPTPPTISTIADVLATVEGGFPEGNELMESPENAWVGAEGKFAYAYKYNDKAIALNFYNATRYQKYIVLSTGVTAEESCYTATTTNNSKLTFNMTNGKLTSIVFYSTEDVTGERFNGTYKAQSPAPATCTVTFDTENDTGGTVQDSSGQKVTEITVPYETTFSVDDNKITIGENVYTAVANSGWAFDSFDSDSGTITDATTITVKFSQNQPD